jgi:hypothetical protein
MMATLQPSYLLLHAAALYGLLVLAPQACRGSPACWRCATKTPITPIADDGSCSSSDANLVQLRATLCQSIGSWPGFPDCKLPGNCSRGYPDCNAEGDWPNQ